eukprot:COSAG01_NODE_5804_length_4022_cov_63.314555_3_plen_155_part_00
MLADSMKTEDFPVKNILHPITRHSRRHPLEKSLQNSYLEGPNEACGRVMTRPTVMLGDNRNARDWAIEDMTTDGNRMIDRKYRIVRERVKKKEILPVWIDGKTNPADVGTKAQANAPMTENMISYLTGNQELPLPDGVQVLFGPVENPVRRGNP